MASMKKWKLLESKMAFENKWMPIQQDKVQLANGNIVDDYFTWLEPDVVLIVPLTKEGKFILVKQYKHGVGDIVIEFPAGYINQDEDKLEAAKRELLEETGIKPQKIELLNSVITNASKIQNQVHIYIATDLEDKVDNKHLLDENEEIETLEVTKIYILDFRYSFGYIQCHGEEY
jgi:ADP-ribose pyrophosphatase